jgi:hypothetical protein
MMGFPIGVDESLLQDKASKFMANQNQAVVFGGVLINALLLQLMQKVFASVGIFIPRSETLNVQLVLEYPNNRRRRVFSEYTM